MSAQSGWKHLPTLSNPPPKTSQPRTGVGCIIGVFLELLRYQPASLYSSHPGFGLELGESYRRPRKEAFEAFLYNS